MCGGLGLEYSLKHSCTALWSGLVCLVDEVEGSVWLGIPVCVDVLTCVLL